MQGDFASCWFGFGAENTRACVCAGEKCRLLRTWRQGRPWERCLRALVAVPGRFGPGPCQSLSPFMIAHNVICTWIEDFVTVIWIFCIRRKARMCRVGSFCPWRHFHPYCCWLWRHQLTRDSFKSHRGKGFLWRPLMPLPTPGLHQTSLCLFLYYFSLESDLFVMYQERLEGFFSLSLRYEACQWDSTFPRRRVLRMAVCWGLTTVWWPIFQRSLLSLSSHKTATRFYCWMFLQMAEIIYFWTDSGTSKRNGRPRNPQWNT